MKVSVKCEDCGKEYEINYKSYKRSKCHLCKRCSGLRRVNDLHNGNTKYFNNIENRKSHSKLCKEIWANRPDEFKANQRKMLKEVGDDYRNSIDVQQVFSDRMIKYFQNPGNRMKMSNSMKRYWGGLTDDAKRSAMLHLTEYWKHISSDDIDQWYRNMLDGRITNGTIIEGPSEIEFCKELDNMVFYNKKCLYRRQYRSTIKHADFDKIFPYNPITGGSLVNPYHIWDFIIYSQYGNILVDIDGSIHNKHKCCYKVKYGNNTVSMADVIAFNESQRPYQTDGLDAYVVKAYNDKLSGDTEVDILHTNGVMTYMDLIDIIYNSQITESDIKFITKSMKISK